MANLPIEQNSKFQENENYNVSNKESIWPHIEADFQFAADSLSATKPDASRANGWAAKCFLAKVYMFQHKFTEAKPLLEDIIANGETANGKKYALCEKYEDNFDPAQRNNSESVFNTILINCGVLCIKNEKPKRVILKFFFYFRIKHGFLLIMQDRKLC